MVFDRLVEERIVESMRDGAFDGLPGTGKPLELDDDRLVPEELRVAYRILKNAGFLPPEIEARREAASLTRLLAADAGAGDGEARRRAATRLALIEATLEARGASTARDRSYDHRILDRLAR